MLIMIGAVVAPGLGVMLSLLMPAPMILLYLQHGKSVGMFGLGAVLVILSLTAGVEAAMGFAAAYAIVVVFLAEGIRFHLEPEKTIAVAALSAALLSGVLLWVALTGEEQSPIEFFQSQLKISAEEYLKAFKKSGAPEEELTFMREVANNYTPVMAKGLVAILLVGSLLTATFNYILVRALWLKFYPRVFFQNSEPSRWILPDQAVWGFIGSFGAMFLGGGALKWVGMNIFIVMTTLYFFQGLAIILAILKAKNASGLVTGIVFLLVLTQPPLMGMVVGLGLFDVWIDFRKIRQRAEEDGSEPK